MYVGGEKINAYIFLGGGTPVGKRQFRSSRHRWGGIILKCILKKQDGRWQQTEFLYLKTGRWWALVGTVMKHRFP